MYKLVAIYRMPDDQAVFDEHYFNVHAPLMAKVPGYERLEVNKVTRTLLGEPQYYLMFEMWFPTEEALKAALRSKENQEAGKDLMSFAGDLVTVFTTQVVQEEHP